MTSLAFHASGTPDRPTIVLLHGVGGNASMWRALMAGLPEYRCLAPDLPGHGDSRDIRWVSRPETAGLVAELIQAEGHGGRAHVVGLSLGGSVALELLANRPDLLDHVIVDGCAAIRGPLPGLMKLGVSVISPFLRFATVSRLIGRAFGVTSAADTAAFAAQMRAVDARSFRRAFADANDVRLTPGLLSARSRTLLVAGEREMRHVRASNRLLAERMPRAEARFVPRAGHGWGAAQYPDLHRQMITAWIENRPLPTELPSEMVQIGTITARAEA